MAEFDSIYDFLKAAPRRLRDAEELLQPPAILPQEHGADRRHLRGAMYLSGYAVEMILKAYIISRNPPSTTLTEARDRIRRRHKGVPDICGKDGHRIDLLLRLTDLEARFDSRIKVCFGVCAKWKASWRYNPNLASRDDAKAMVEAARDIYTWVGNQVR